MAIDRRLYCKNSKYITGVSSDNTARKVLATISIKKISPLRHLLSPSSQIPCRLSTGELDSATTILAVRKHFLTHQVAASHKQAPPPKKKASKFNTWNTLSFNQGRKNFECFPNAHSPISTIAGQSTPCKLQELHNISHVNERLACLTGWWWLSGSNFERRFSRHAA